MNQIKIFVVSLLLSCSNTFAQDSGVYQTVNIEQYQGMNFTLEGKIYYTTDLANDSYAVLGASSYDSKGKTINKIIYNDNAEDYYKKGEWSSYELSGKIDKKAKYFGVMATFGGTANYYLDDFKLFVNDGKNKIEIPLVNPGFENDGLKNWQTYIKDKGTRFTLSKDKVFSGTQSLFVDHSSVKTLPTLGNNHELGKYMEVNGVKLYYEVYGKGEPLLMLNGNNSSMAILTSNWMH